MTLSAHEPDPRPVTRFGLLPRRPGLTIEEFQAHWRSTHAPLGASMPGVMRYWQNHRLPASPGCMLPWPGFDACSEMDAVSLEAHVAMRSSEVFLGPIAADEPRFLDADKSGAVWTRRTLTEGRIGSGVRLMAFCRRAPLVPTAEFAALIEEPERGEGAIGREVFIGLTGRDAGQLVSVFDAVECLWFGERESAENYLAGAHERDRHAVAGVVRGTEHLLAETVQIV
jgi:hypothetical protein